MTSRSGEKRKRGHEPAAATVDPVALAQALIRCPSVTPADAGAIDVLAAALEPLGFTCHRLAFRSDGAPVIENLYARLGDQPPNLCFGGHTDVVPVGDWTRWTRDPFSGDIEADILHGRGAADMKGALAAMAAGIARYLARFGPPKGSISLLITGDEEGRAIAGTKAVLDWLAERGERLDGCVLGEPTNPDRLGTMVKIGRRGSLTGRLFVEGVQGHVAYPHLADNPLPRLIAMLAALDGLVLDRGTAHFDASNLEIVSIDVGNGAANVIPAAAQALFNVRFNDLTSSAALEALLRRTLDGVGGAYRLEVEVSGESFLCPPGRLAETVRRSVEAVTGILPVYSTTGGTSDGRFIHRHCPVVEFGLCGATMHKVDECVPVADIEALTEIYRGVLERFFAG